jgi:hypothetical protein
MDYPVLTVLPGAIAPALRHEYVLLRVRPTLTYLQLRKATGMKPTVFSPSNLFNLPTLRALQG